MTEIIKLVSRKNLIASDTPQVLRNLADKVESGEVTDMILGCVENGGYELMRFSNLQESLVLVNLLHNSIMKGFGG